MDRLKDMIAKLPKLAWYIGGAELPARQAVSYLNFCIHTEMIYDTGIYKALTAFSKDFFVLTGKRIAVCISTPACPYVKAAMSKNGFADEDFASRILELARFAEIGYHGHFYDEGPDGLTQVSRNHYPAELVSGQIRKEMKWFGSIGIRPRIYVAGWWFMTADIVLELERSGLEVDVSVRKGKYDTFGTRYMDDGDLPRAGRPFILPPSKNVVEIQSIFGPVMQPPVMKGHLGKYLKVDPAQELFFIFPLHDWDLPKYYRNIWSNTECLSRHWQCVSWMDIPDMRRHYMNKAKADKVEYGQR